MEENKDPRLDTNVPVDQYMETLGANTLAGQTFTTALARQMSNLDRQSQSTQQSYQDMYEQARMMSTRRRGLSDTTGFTGGMADQFSARMSAAEIAQMSQIGMGREQAVRDIDTARMAAPSNAFIEAQQAQQYSDYLTSQSEPMKRLDVLRQYGDLTGNYQDYFTLANEVFGTNVQASTARREQVDAEGNVVNRTNNAPGTVDTLSESGVDVNTYRQEQGIVDPTTPLTSTQYVCLVTTEFKDLDIDDAIVKNSPFQDNQIATTEQLSQLAYELGRDKAAQDPNYNFQYEINMLSRAVLDRTSLTREEWEGLEEYTRSFAGNQRTTFTPGVTYETGPKYNIADTPSGRAFMEYLISEGIIDTNDYKSNKRTIWNDTGGIFKQYDNILNVDNTDISHSEFDELYYDFLDDYNREQYGQE
jgi:hypothetical protein